MSDVLPVLAGVHDTVALKMKLGAEFAYDPIGVCPTTLMPPINDSPAVMFTDHPQVAVFLWFIYIFTVVPVHVPHVEPL
jgi:hypothetical protein